MPNFWKVINYVIEQSDILLEVLDSRDVENTRNIEIEDKVERSGKKLLYVFNKSDLVDEKILSFRTKNLKPSVFISAKEHSGVGKLRELIHKNSTAKQVVVGVLGYPNTGKSSLINALASGGRASTSSESGHTKGSQFVRVSQKIKIIDTPGVIPYKEKNNEKLAMIGSLDPSKVKDPEDVVIKIMQEYPGLLEDYYGVIEQDDLELVLADIALKQNFLIKGGEPNLDRSARKILRDWQQGNIRR